MANFPCSTTSPLAVFTFPPFIKSPFPVFPSPSLLHHLLHSIFDSHCLHSKSSSFSSFWYINSHRKHKTELDIMCSSKAKVTIGIEITPLVSRINGRQVLQPTCNRVASLDPRSSLKKVPTPPPLPLSTSSNNTSTSPGISTKASLAPPPVSPKSKSPRPRTIKRPGNDPNGLNSSSERVVTPGGSTKAKALERKKSESFKLGVGADNINSHDHGRIPYGSNEASLSYSSFLIIEAPGSIAAGRREHMALQHAQRKMKIAHYGRSKSANFERAATVDKLDTVEAKASEEDHKRCSFITANSDPIYVAYHDQEWGVPVHDDKMLFELLVLNGAQVGSDWTSILKKRNDFREAFSGFDAEAVANLSDKQMMSICSEYGIDISRVRGVVDNSNRILEVKREFGSFQKYIWEFVNHKPICPQYKQGYKIAVKTSKSESISKDMVRRGFRFVGPTVVHSFMQASGLTNDHLTTCHRHTSLYDY